jgi:hypothetical protein
MLKVPPEPAPEPQAPARPSRRGEDRGRRPVSPSPAPAATREARPVPAVLPNEPEELEAASDHHVGSDAPPAALARLGPEALLRLRGRYAELLTRIAQRVTDPAQQDELKSKAERLNPDTWVTDEEVTLGLDAYEATFEEIRAVVGRPRKRRRRRRGARADASDANGATTVENPDGEAEPSEGDDEGGDEETPH